MHTAEINLPGTNPCCSVCVVQRSCTRGTSIPCCCLWKPQHHLPGSSLSLGGWLPHSPLISPYPCSQLPPVTTSHAMFYGSSSTMAPPSKSRLKRQSRLFSQVLYRTLSYKDRSSTSAFPDGDDPAELSTQLSAPGILKIFGGNICVGTNYKSVLATGSSGALELVKEALERYGLSQLNAGQYALCDVIGRFEGPEKRWQTEGLRVLGDHEKPLLIQDLWKPREGFSRRLELRRRAEVEEMAARDVDTTTAGQGQRLGGVCVGVVVGAGAAFWLQCS